MKKINLILIALMALIFVSCSENETVMSIPEEANAVLFDTYTGRAPQTRGVEMTDTKLQEDHFGVLGYYTAQTVWSEAAAKTTPNFMYNQEVKHEDSAWTYSPIKYWPTTQNDKVSFFAYAPYVEVPVAEETNNKGIVLSGNTGIGNPTITFTVQDNPENMVDLVTASVVDQGNKVEVDSQTAPQVVNFTFKHALSRVNFIAKAHDNTVDGGIDDKTIINITDVKLDGITGGQFYKSGKYTLSSTDAKGVWSDQTAFTTSEGYDIAGILANTTPVVHGEYSVGGVKLEGVSPVNLFTGSQYLFLIPAGETGLTEAAATVTFEYDIVTLDSKLAKGFSVTSATKTVNLPKGTLQQGVAYNYTFTFNVDQVEVTAEVAKWDTVNGGKVDVDYTHPN